MIDKCSPTWGIEGWYPKGLNSSIVLFRCFKTLSAGFTAAGCSPSSLGWAIVWNFTSCSAFLSKERFWNDSCESMMLKSYWFVWYYSYHYRFSADELSRELLSIAINGFGNFWFSLLSHVPIWAWAFSLFLPGSAALVPLSSAATATSPFTLVLNENGLRTLSFKPFFGSLLISNSYSNASLCTILLCLSSTWKNFASWFSKTTNTSLSCIRGKTCSTHSSYILSANLCSG